MISLYSSLSLVLPDSAKVIGIHGKSNLLGNVQGDNASMSLL